MKILSWEHFQDINCTTTVSVRANVGMPVHVHDWDGCGLKGWFVALFLAALETTFFLNKRASISSSVSLCSFEAVGGKIHAGESMKKWEITSEDFNGTS